MADGGCSHRDSIGAVVPGTLGCEECLATGDWWVHLRLCRSCGHVGCCDDSPNRHAHKHFEASGHPIIEGYDPPEGWGWCYLDEIVVSLPDRTPGEAQSLASSEPPFQDPSSAEWNPEAVLRACPPTEQGTSIMGIFSSIRDAIFGKAKAQPAPQAQSPAQPQAMPQLQPGQPAQAPVQPQAQQPVDVEQVLVGIAQEKGNPDLNWRTSIVDLMKLLDLDSSLANRKELATELGYSGEKDGSAEMNIWLQKAVMNELEKNGGKVPAGLKD